MDILKIESGKIALIKHKVVIRDYHYPHDKSVSPYVDIKECLTDSEWKEWSEQQIPKHARYELISHEEIDISGYAWCDGVDVSQEVDPLLTAKEMAKYRSLAEYQASLPENQAAYQLDTDFRLSKIELGI